MRTFALILLVLLAGGCMVERLPPHNYAKEPDPRAKPFMLGPSDVLQIHVWRNPNLSTGATVRPDGTITLPLVGDLRAFGRTTIELQAEIKARLQAFVPDATVTVAVAQVNSYRFTVTGQVARPGLFSSRSYVTVNEAIAMAGGPTRFAAASRVIVVRQTGQGKRVRRIPVDYTQVASGKRPDADIVILPGDTIYVP